MSTGKHVHVFSAFQSELFIGIWYTIDHEHLSPKKKTKNKKQKTKNKKTKNKNKKQKTKNRQIPLF